MKAPSDFNRHHYNGLYAELNATLNQIRAEGGLEAAFEYFHQQQLDVGFLDRESVVNRYPFRSTSHPELILTVQHTPIRANRHNGKGRSPDGACCKCFICRAGFYHQQRGLQMGFDITLAGVPHVALCNPFALASRHFTIATESHIQHSWFADQIEATLAQFRYVAGGLIELVSQLPPDWVAFHSGDAAGASIVGHRHLHLLKRTVGYRRFALEAAREISKMKAPGGAPTLITDYPIAAMYFAGPEKNAVVAQACNLVRDWIKATKVLCELTANVIVTFDANGIIHLYVVPRTTAFSRAAGVSGAIGSLEVLGEIVLTSDTEADMLAKRLITFDYLWEVLESVEPPGIRGLLSRIQRGRNG